MKLRDRHSICWLCLLLLLAGKISAQTGPEMLINPWEDKQRVNLLGSSTLFGQSHLRKTDDSFQMQGYAALGRWRVLGDRIESPVVGFKFNELQIDTPNTALPDHLVNTGFSVGSPVGLIGDKWFVLAIAGVGYAGDSWFADPDAVYYTGTVLVGKRFDKDRALIFGLDYDGSRTFLPDVPLPGIAYRSLVNDRLKYTVGVPFLLIEWTPIDEVAVTARYSLLSRIEASVDYHIYKKQLSLFSHLTDTAQGFHRDETSGDRRIFFERKAMEAGVRWSPRDNMTVTGAFGYQFSQRFSEGFSLRNTDLLAKPADVPYLRLQLELQF